MQRGGGAHGAAGLHVLFTYGGGPAAVCMQAGDITRTVCAARREQERQTRLDCIWGGGWGHLGRPARLRARAICSGPPPRRGSVASLAAAASSTRREPGGGSSSPLPSSSSPSSCGVVGVRPQAAGQGARGRQAIGHMAWHCSVSRLVLPRSTAATPPTHWNGGICVHSHRRVTHWRLLGLARADV